MDSYKTGINFYTKMHKIEFSQEPNDEVRLKITKYNMPDKEIVINIYDTGGDGAGISLEMWRDGDMGGPFMVINERGLG